MAKEIGHAAFGGASDLARLRSAAHRVETFKLSTDPLFVEKVYFSPTRTRNRVVCR